MKLRTLLYALAGAVVVVVVGFAVYAPSQELDVGSSSSFNFTRYGTHAFYELLSERGHRVERLGRTPLGWPREGTVVAVRPVLTTVQSSGAGPGAGMMAAMGGGAVRSWLERGNTLISFGAPPGFSNELGYSGTDVASLVSGSRVPSGSFGDETEMGFHYYEPSLTEGETETLVASSNDVPALTGGLEVSASIVPSEVVTAVGYSQDPYQVVMPGALLRGGQPLGPLAVVQRVGEGRVVYVNLSQPVMNGWIARNDNAAFGVGMVESFHEPGRGLYFYEVPHGRFESGTSLTALLIQTPGGNLLLGLLLAAVLMVLPAAVTFHRDENLSRETGGAGERKFRHRLAAFYSGAGDWEYAVIGLVQGLRFSLSERGLEGSPLSLERVMEEVELILEPEAFDSQRGLITAAVRACGTGDFTGFTKPRVHELARAIDVLHRVRPEVRAAE